MMTLSILLPSYNNVCVQIVTELQRQADDVPGLEYEIIVADDGGEDMAVKQQNSEINALPNCRYIIREKNVGRSAIRNFLTSEARGEWLLFIDSDVAIIKADYVKRYVEATKDYVGVLDGGVEAIGNPEEMRSNLRFWYEYSSQSQHTADKRSLTPYQHIHTANLMAPRSIMLSHGFDERFTRYGYEDVLFGKEIEKAGIAIKHIDAPVGLDKFESNEAFLRKTEEALGTLHFFRAELDGYSVLLHYMKRLRRCHLLCLTRLFHKLFSGRLKRNLCGNRPSLLAFKIYKVGYYATLK